jgi:heterodisulfide reductase subunit A-like polyferredoxin
VAAGSILRDMTDKTRRSSETTTPGDEAAVDVIVAGGGLAGLAGALTLVRARRSVLVAAVEPGRGAVPAHRAQPLR